MRGGIALPAGRRPQPTRGIGKIVQRSGGTLQRTAERDEDAASGEPLPKVRAASWTRQGRRAGHRRKGQFDAALAVTVDSKSWSKRIAGGQEGCRRDGGSMTQPLPGRVSAAAHITAPARRPGQQPGRKGGRCAGSWPASFPVRFGWRRRAVTVRGLRRASSLPAPLPVRQMPRALSSVALS